METETLYGLVGFGLGVGVSYAYFRTQMKSLLSFVDKIFENANDVNSTNKRKTLEFRDRLRNLGDIMGKKGMIARGINSYVNSIEAKLTEEIQNDR